MKTKSARQTFPYQALRFPNPSVPQQFVGRHLGHQRNLPQLLSPHGCILTLNGGYIEEASLYKFGTRNYVHVCTMLTDLFSDFIEFFPGTTHNDHIQSLSRQLVKGMR